jgi:H+/Cl- antiporter ClcA
MHGQKVGARLKLKTIAGVVLIGLGVVAFAYQGLSYTTFGHDMNLGWMHLSTQRTHFIPLPPVLGVTALIAGIALLLVDKTDFKSEATP